MLEQLTFKRSIGRSLAECGPRRRKLIEIKVVAFDIIGGGDVLKTLKKAPVSGGLD